MYELTDSNWHTAVDNYFRHVTTNHVMLIHGDDY